MTVLTNQTPCQWAGGNDTCYCRTCGIEYEYGKVSKPPCGAAAEIDRLRARAEQAEAQLRDTAGQINKAVEGALLEKRAAGEIFTLGQVAGFCGRARRKALEDAAQLATDFAAEVQTFGCIPSDPFESMTDGARRLAKAIRALKGGAV